MVRLRKLGKGYLSAVVIELSLWKSPHGRYCPGSRFGTRCNGVAYGELDLRIRP